MKNLRLSSRNKGFTLVELMIAVAIISILAAVALPLYNSYIATSREGVLVNNISTLEVFQEDFRLRNGNYLLVAADAAAIEAAIGWTPQVERRHDLRHRRRRRWHLRSDRYRSARHRTSASVSGQDPLLIP